MAVIVTIKGVDGRAPSLARGLPITLTWEDKTIAQLTISDVKARLAEKFPKVCTFIVFLALLLNFFNCPVYPIAPKAYERNDQKAFDG